MKSSSLSTSTGSRLEMLAVSSSGAFLLSKPRVHPSGELTVFQIRFTFDRVMGTDLRVWPPLSS